jgi:RNA polymerase sigma factor (sigma-70 family)
MSDHDWLAGQFEENRGHLRGVAYRMLGSLGEADDAVQECWLRLSRSETDDIDNLRGWLTTVVARICFDMLRSRKSRREEAFDAMGPEPTGKPASAADPEAEAMLADSVGYATLVVLDRLNPAERIAFVLHDVFDIPFEEIAHITGRLPEAARQLASRARRRVRGVTTLPDRDLALQRDLAEKFLTALRLGDPLKLMEVLDPAFAVQADAVAAPRGVPTGIHDAESWAKQAVQSARGARLARLAVVEGSVGLIVAPRGRLVRVLRFTYANDRVAGMEVIGDPERLRTIEIAELTAVLYARPGWVPH